MRRQDCAFISEIGCLILTETAYGHSAKTNCEGCNFYRDRKSLDSARKRALLRISALDEKTRGRIAKKYYRGKRPWVEVRKRG